MSITLTKLGSKILVQVEGLQPIYKDHNDVEVNYIVTDNTLTDTVSVNIRNGQNIEPVLLVYITINGNAITNKSEFETQLAILFPNEGGGSSSTPIVGIVGGAGMPNDGDTNYTNAALIGLSGNLQIVVAEQILSSYGSNAAFNFDNVLGKISLLFGNTFILNDSIFINTNQ